ncbi:MAG: GFA family protein [bacterium]
MRMRIEGKCHCGKISITAEVDPNTATACHCTDCQMFGGGPFRTGVVAKAESTQIEGDPKEYTKIAESGNPRIQAFCGECGTSLYATDLNKTVFNLRTGFLKQREELIPKKHIFGDSSAKWLKDLDQHQWFPKTPQK